MISETAASGGPWTVTPNQDLVKWFIWQEAELLDRQDYKRWLDLWTPGGLYIIPTEHERRQDYRDAVNVVYDDAAMRLARVKRMTSGFSVASAPSARTARLLSRFVIEEETAEAISVRTAMLLTEYKYEHTRLLAADVDYRIALGDGGWRLDQKIVRLINADDYLPTIGYLL